MSLSADAEFGFGFCRVIYYMYISVMKRPLVNSPIAL